jgi:predicted O-linked N-acetylglucosamine transferase (SPINDLY family)
MTIQQAFELALQHHQSGRLAEAEAIYRQILAVEPRHADALHLLGVIAHQVGSNDIAMDLIRQAIALAPGVADYHSNLGEACRAVGQLDEAIAAYRQAIALKPDLPEAHCNLGNALRDKGQLDEAIAAFRQAIALKPQYAKAHNNLGTALRDKGQVVEAIAAYRQAIALKPDMPEAHYNLSFALKDQGQLDEAIAACRRAILLKPDMPEAHCTLGVALKDRGQLDGAIAAYRQAIALKPDLAEAHSNLGNALRDKGQADEAIAAYRQAIALKPVFAEAFSNLGNAFKDKGELDEAIAAYRQAIAIEPEASDLHSNLLLTLNYHPGSDAQAIATEQRRWNRQHAEPMRRFIQPHTNDLTPGRQLRIGYVSADFMEHASACFLVPLIERHDPEEVELFCYALVPQCDAITRRLQRRVVQWRSTVGLTDEQFAAQIRADRIDILIDLKLHTAQNRLPVFARKPAPIQVSWLGFPGSTGLTTIDYRLSDPHLDPPGGDESVYSEQTVRLPHTFWCYDPVDCCDMSAGALPALSNGFITFGCLNNFCKINEGVLRLWSKVLQTVPASRLLLLAPEGSHRRRTLDVLRLEGIASERIEFVSPQPRRKYLELYRRIDLCLDTLPYNGHTTGLDSFWMGVPVVTLVGQTIVGRAGLSQSMNLDLPELVAWTPDQYVKIASGLASDLPRLAQLRGTLRQRMEASPLMEAPRFARDIEAAYREMWRKWCNKPESVAIAGGGGGQ